MLMRVSVGIHKNDIDAAIETYNLLSERWFTHASPTLFNAGTNRPQLSRYLGLSSMLNAEREEDEVLVIGAVQMKSCHNF